MFTNPNRASNNWISENDLENSVIERIIRNEFYQTTVVFKKAKINWSEWIPGGNCVSTTEHVNYQNQRQTRPFFPASGTYPSYPQLSTLTISQHHQCLRVLAAKNCHVQPRDYPEPSKMDYKVFEEVKELYEKEQIEYIKWAKLCWINGICIRALRPKPIIETVYEAEFKMRASPVKFLPQELSWAAQISLETKDHVFEFVHKEDLINVDVLDLPVVDYPEELPRNLSILKPIALPEPCTEHPCKFVLPNSNSVSKLPLYEIHKQLALYGDDNNAQAVASENALRCLLELHRCWKLPVSVVQLPSSDGELKTVLVMGSEFNVHKDYATHRTHKAYRHLLRHAFVPSIGHYKIRKPVFRPSQSPKGAAKSSASLEGKLRVSGVNEPLHVDVPSNMPQAAVQLNEESARSLDRDMADSSDDERLEIIDDPGTDNVSPDPPREGANSTATSVDRDLTLSSDDEGLPVNDGPGTDNVSPDPPREGANSTAMSVDRDLTLSSDDEGLPVHGGPGTGNASSDPPREGANSTATSVDRDLTLSSDDEGLPVHGGPAITPAASCDKVNHEETAKTNSTNFFDDFDVSSDDDDDRLLIDDKTANDDYKSRMDPNKSEHSNISDPMTFMVDRPTTQPKTSQAKSLDEELCGNDSSSHTCVETTSVTELGSSIEQRNTIIEPGKPNVSETNTIRTNHIRKLSFSDNLFTSELANKTNPVKASDSKTQDSIDKSTDKLNASDPICKPIAHSNLEIKNTSPLKSCLKKLTNCVDEPGTSCLKRNLKSSDPPISEPEKNIISSSESDGNNYDSDCIPLSYHCGPKTKAKLIMSRTYGLSSRNRPKDKLTKISKKKNTHGLRRSLRLTMLTEAKKNTNNTNVNCNNTNVTLRRSLRLKTKKTSQNEDVDEPKTRKSPRLAARSKTNEKQVSNISPPSYSKSFKSREIDHSSTSPRKYSIVPDTPKRQTRRSSTRPQIPIIEKPMSPRKSPRCVSECCVNSKIDANTKVSNIPKYELRSYSIFNNGDSESRRKSLASNNMSDVKKDTKKRNRRHSVPFYKLTKLNEPSKWKAFTNELSKVAKRYFRLSDPPTSSNEDETEKAESTNRTKKYTRRSSSSKCNKTDMTDTDLADLKTSRRSKSKSKSQLTEQACLSEIANTENTPQSEIANTLQSEIVNTEKAPQSEIGDTENTPQLEIANTGKATLLEIVNAEKALQSEIVNTEKAPQSEIGDTENTPQLEIANTGKATLLEIANAEKPLQSEIVNTEKAPQSEIADTENIPQSEILNTGKATLSEIANTETALQSEIADTDKAPQSEIANTEKAQTTITDQFNNKNVPESQSDLNEVMQFELDIELIEIPNIEINQNDVSATSMTQTETENLNKTQDSSLPEKSFKNLLKANKKLRSKFHSLFLDSSEDSCDVNDDTEQNKHANETRAKLNSTGTKELNLKRSEENLFQTEEVNLEVDESRQTKDTSGKDQLANEDQTEVNAQSETFNSTNENDHRDTNRTEATERDHRRPILTIRSDDYNINKDLFNDLTKDDINEIIGVKNCACKGTLFEIPPPRSFKKWQLSDRTTFETLDVIVHMSHKVRKGVNETLLEPIVEYQPEYGGAKQTPSRVRSLALELMLRDSPQLLNVRVDYEKGEVILIEQISHDEFLERHGEQMASIANTLHSALAQLRHLRPGQYVLHHDPRHGPHAMLYTTRRLQSDIPKLSLNYDNIQMPDTEDANHVKKPFLLEPVLLPYHKIRKILPCAFPPYKNLIKKSKKKAAKRKAAKKAKLPPQAMQWKKKKKKIKTIWQA